MTAIERLYFEDVAVGTNSLAPPSPSNAKSYCGSRNFDNQPMHTDLAAARHGAGGYHRARLIPSR